MRRGLIYILALLALVGCRRPKEAAFPAAELDSVLTQLFPEEQPGAEVLILRHGEVVYEHHSGLADLTTRAPIDASTFFNIASCSKQFTAVAVLQLVADGRVDLDASVSAYFPEYSSPLMQDIRVRHLLSHSSGIPDLRGYLSREEKIRGDEDLAVEYISTLPCLQFAPGTAYEYINPTFVLLGKLVERVSGMPFVDYVREHIFLPAGMSSTLYFHPSLEDRIPNMAHGYEYADVSDMPEERTASAGPEEKSWYEYDYGEETFFATRPDGGIYTSANQLIMWERYLTTTLADTTAFANLLREAMQPHIEVCGPYSDYQNRPGTWYGYGWFVEPEKACVYHTGDNGGFKILIARYPTQDACVMVLANRADWDRYALKSYIETLL